MKIAMVDLKTQYQSLKKDIDMSIQRVLDSCNFILGKEVEDFEKESAAYLGIKHAIAAASGTDALFMAMLALNIGPDDEVITTPFTFFATAESISLAGAKPVFVDINPKTYNIDIEKIEKAITSRTKAIIPVHLYGHTASMEQIVKIAEKYKLKIIEDVAQAMGAEYNGKKVGISSDIACYSFFPAKNLGCYGDGGMAVTNNPELNKQLRIIRNHGDESRYTHVRLGINGRLDALQAAILRVKLPHLDNWIDLRNKKADLYSSLLKSSGVTLPYKEKNIKHAYNQYTIRLKNRDKLKTFLEEHGIASTIHYPIPLHLQKVYKDLGYKIGDLPESEKAAQEVLSLPIYPEINDNDIKFVCEKICEFVNKNEG